MAWNMLGWSSHLAYRVFSQWAGKIYRGDPPPHPLHKINRRVPVPHDLYLHKSNPVLDKWLERGWIDGYMDRWIDE